MGGRRGRLFLAALLCSVLIVLSAGPAAAYDFAHAEARLAFRVPDSWSIERAEDGLVAQDESGELQFQFQLLRHVDPNLALADVRQLIADEFGALDKPQEKRVKRNGLPAFSLEAGARYGDRPIRLWVDIVETPSKRQGLFIAFADAQVEKRHRDEVQRILAGVGPLRRAAPKRPRN